MPGMNFHEGLSVVISCHHVWSYILCHKMYTVTQINTHFRSCLQINLFIEVSAYNLHTQLQSCILESKLSAVGNSSLPSHLPLSMCNRLFLLRCMMSCFAACVWVTELFDPLLVVTSLLLLFIYFILIFDSFISSCCLCFFSTTLPPNGHELLCIKATQHLACQASYHTFS